MSALRVRGVSKTYGAVRALHDVDLDLAKGEIHALAGENGAGKSTLAKVLYGETTADSGTVELFGEPFRPRGPREAVRRGVGLVHQHFMLVDPLTVAENAVLGDEPARLGWIDRKAASRRVAELSERFGLALDPDVPVEQLSVGEKQRLEILKVLLRGAEFLILDEPTAVLTPAESRSLFRTIRQLADEGATVLFVTHRLGEVVEHAQRVTVLRRGERVATVDAATTTERELACHIVGREPAPPEVSSAPPRAEVALAVRSLTAHSGGRPALQDVSFELHAGEILGVAGVEGNGQRELVEAIAGLHPWDGEIELAGESVRGLDARAIRARGVAHVPEDRLAAGIVAEMSVAENLMLGRESRFRRGFAFDPARVREHARERIAAFDVRPTDADLPLSALSGGNQQKVVIAREVEGEPKLVLAAHPTRGVDVGAAEAVHETLLSLRAQGAAVLLISSDLGEIRMLSDRVLVMYGGKIAGEFAREDASEEALGLLMIGGHA